MTRGIKKTERAFPRPEARLDRVDNRILAVRGHRVMMDADLAEVYGVTTRRLNEQVKRNVGRFPEDFLFRLTMEEKTEVVAKCDHLSRLRFSPVLPFAFTEHGAIMAASVLNSPQAIEASVYVVRAFVRLREVLSTHKELARKMEALERKYSAHDEQIKAIFDAIRALMVPPAKSGRRIGF